MNTPIKNSQFVGIDLGTTNTVIAYYDDTGKPKVINNLDGDPKTQSIVHVSPDGKEVLVGTSARSMQVVDPEHTVREFKRDVGTDQEYFSAGKISVTSDWCQTQVLKYCRESAIKHFDDDRAASRAVITVPAYFGEKERQSVVRSAHEAGIVELQLINEPTAAGLAYGIQEQQGDRVVAILDLGGGTFDVSLVQFMGVEINVLATHGDKRLGGKDVDDLLMRMVQKALEKEHSIEFSIQSHPADWYVVLDEVLRQKHLLSARNEVKLCARVDGKQVIVPVKRKTLTDACQPLLDRCERIVHEALQNGKVDPKDIQQVLLIGGSSRLICFQELAKRIFGANSLLSGQTSPDLAVAEGAVIQAAKLVSESGGSIVNESLHAIPAPTIKHTDVMPHSLGICVQDRVSGAGYCSVILERNTSIPCQAVKTYGSVDDSQTSFKISILQGEDGQRAGDCLEVGAKVMDFPARSHAEASLEVSLGYDASGMVNLTIKDLVSRRTEDITVDFYKTVEP